MKEKSSKKKRGSSLNESSATLVEPSFSKITFRKRGIDNSSEMLPNVCEEDEDVCPAEGLIKSNLSINDLEFSKSKKKKKKKKQLSEEYSVSFQYELNEEKGGLKFTNEEKDKAPDHLQDEPKSNELSFSENTNIKKKKSKKKKEETDFSEGAANANQYELDLGNRGFVGENDDAADVLRAVELKLVPKKTKNKHKLKSSGEELQSSSLEVMPEKNDDKEGFPGSIETGPNTPNKKRKKKYLQSEEVVEETVVPTDFQLVHKKKKKVHQLMDESNLNISSNEQLLYDETGTENSLITASSGFNIPNKKHRKKHLQSEDIVKKTGNFIDSPLIREKKKKVHRLMDESNLNKSIDEQFLNDGSVAEKNLVVTSNDLSTLQQIVENTIESPILHKNKKKARKLTDESVLDTSHIKQLENNRSSEESFVITGCDDLKVSQGQSVKKPKKKHKLSSEIINTNFETMADNSDGSKIRNNNTEISLFKNITNNRKNNENSLTNELPKDKNVSEKNKSKHFKESLLTSCNELLNPLCLDFKKTKKKKKGELINKSAKQTITSAVTATSIESKDLITGTGAVVIKSHDNTLKAGEEVTETENKTSSPKKKKTVKNSIENLRKKLLKAARSDSEKSEDLPSETTKQTKKVEQNVDTLRLLLLREAVGDTAKTEGLSLKPNKKKMKVKNSVNARLAKKAQKSEKFDKGSKGKKDKKKHKLKKIDDIDKLTEILISKALQKVSSSGTSHSSQENIDANVETENTHLKNSGTTENKNKIVPTKKLKSSLPESKQVRDQKLLSEDKSEIEKIQNSLLTQAMKYLHPNQKSPKKKSPTTNGTRENSKKKEAKKKHEKNTK